MHIVESDCKQSNPSIPLLRSLVLLLLCLFQWGLSLFSPSPTVAMPEVELTIKAVIGGWRIVEIPISLAGRPRGSHSKIRGLRDGMAILGVILSLLRKRRTSAPLCAKSV